MMTKFFYNLILWIGGSCIVIVILGIINWLVLIPAGITKPLYDYYYKGISEKELTKNELSYSGTLEFKQIDSIDASCIEYCRNISIYPDGNIFNVVYSAYPKTRTVILQMYNFETKQWSKQKDLSYIIPEDEHFYSIRSVSDPARLQIITNKSLFESTDQGLNWYKKDINEAILKKLNMIKSLDNANTFRKYFNQKLASDHNGVPMTRINKTLLPIEESSRLKYTISNIKVLESERYSTTIWNDNRLRKFITSEHWCSPATGCSYGPKFDNNKNIYIIQTQNDGIDWSPIYRVDGSLDFDIVSAVAYDNIIKVLLEKSEDLYIAEIQNQILQ